MEKILIVSDIFTPDELYENLNISTHKTEGLILDLQKEPEGTMALDPIVLSAIISGGFSALTVLITCIFALEQKYIEKEK